MVLHVEYTVNISNWKYIEDSSVSCDSQQIGGYDYVNNVIRIFGGTRNNSAEYTVSGICIH